ncbi:glucan biosynthesis protein G [Cognatiyoonia sp. IB215446]|uniref:glucan biosynthesis protein G n=1 Tax=Cognatiyoonia sp. IB215446 TaxID=3097355 RepID=UPI002A11118C|nr:glucan biosynthesis protein G [Cognatiyoonia sp. IB215446]MDX8349421.1 glucan biosynthesis protein G [Cognatiyoonia sp. IB215446]
MKRRTFLKSTAAFIAFGASRVMAQDAPDLSLLKAARALRDEPYVPNTTPLSAPFADLDYDAFRGIRPIEGVTAGLPHGDRFAVDLLPPGLYFPDPVKVDRMTPDGLQEIAFSPQVFSYEPRYFDDIPETSPGAGFTGMRLRYPLNAPDRMDEVLVMQGASYFRAIGEAMVYGLSARTVAVGTGGPEAEEFPRFVHLRMHAAEGDAVRVEGVIDSPSLTGHLDMTLYPGRNTEMAISTTIFPRVDIADIGIAPLTSMYLKGPMLSAVSDDFRPRVHDSDVLVIRNGAGEHLWRPIANPRNVETSAFGDVSPKSFGLYQTARRYEDFQDTEARYHDRPSAKVTPQGDWGAGAVMLVELPTGDEFMDNIVAFWRPQNALMAGQEYRFDYRLTWTRDQPDLGHLPTILQARSGREHNRPGFRRYVIDVAAPADDTMLVASTNDGAEITGESTFALPGQSATRMTFLFSPGDLQSAEIRVSLRGSDGTPLSPVWLHRWTPARDGGV